MSTFERDNYQWRETYFVLFDIKKRPKMKRAKELLAHLSQQFELQDEVEEDGLFESATLVAHEDRSAVDVSFLDGEDATEERDRLLDELRGSLTPEQKKNLQSATARFDVMHFQEMAGEEDEDPDDFDPTALLMVMGALVKLTGGLGIDPQSGTILDV